MARKPKRRKGGAKKTKPGPSDPAAKLRQEHPELSKEQARAIVASGLTFEQWQSREDEAREQRRQEEERRVIAFIRSRHPQLTASQAEEIFRRNITPEDYLRELEPSPPLPAAERRVAIDELIAKHPEFSRAQAGQVVSGQTTVERLKIAIERKGKRSSRSSEEQARAASRMEQRRRRHLEHARRQNTLCARSEAHLRQLLQEERTIEVHRFHASRCRGTLCHVAPYVLRLQPADPERSPLKLRKLDCAALHPLQHSEVIRSQVRVRPEQAALMQYPPYFSQRPEPEPLAAGTTRGFLLHNGLLLDGTVRWSDPLHLLLDLPAGGELFLFRHAVLQSAETPLATPGDPTLAEWLRQAPDRRRADPTELPLERILLDQHHLDFAVDRTHPRYQAYREQLARRQGFGLEPLLVRRRGDRYYLFDGLRRLEVAKEHGCRTVPVRLV